MHAPSLRKLNKEGISKCPPRRKQARERGGNCVYVRARAQRNSSDASRRMLGLNNLRLAFISSDSKMKDSHQTR